MESAGVDLRNRLVQHAEAITAGRSRRDEIKHDISLRFRAASSGAGASFARALAAHLGALSERWLAFHAEPFEWLNGSRVVRGTDQPWPEDIEHETRIEAMLDKNPVFDALRLDFF